MEKDNIPAEGPQLARAILFDMDIIDSEIMARYPFKNDVQKILSEVWGLHMTKK